MRGKKEQRCLNRARKQLDIKNCYTVSEAEFQNIKTCLELAKPNSQDSVFPDFLFPGGFIEHFQITSGRESRKGSAHSVASVDFHRNCDRKLDELANANNKTEVRASMQYRGHSHENLITSFKRNWEKHLDSLERAPQLQGHLGIFIVQYCDVFALQMHGECYAPLGKGLSPISGCDNPNGYKLSRDKELLQYLQRYKGVIKYVIFVDIAETEIIAIDHVGTRLTELLPWDYIVVSGHPAEFYIGSSFSTDYESETE